MIDDLVKSDDVYFAATAITDCDLLKGVLMFMPPEQITSFKQSKPTVDIYAMGVTLYFLLTARYPLNFPGPWDTKRGMRLAKDPVRMILEDMPTPVRERRRDLSPALAAVVAPRDGKGRRAALPVCQGVPGCLVELQ